MADRIEGNAYIVGGRMADGYDPPSSDLAAPERAAWNRIQSDVGNESEPAEALKPADAPADSHADAPDAPGAGDATPEGAESGWNPENVEAFAQMADALARCYGEHGSPFADQLRALHAERNRLLRQRDTARAENRRLMRIIAGYERAEQKLRADLETLRHRDGIVLIADQATEEPG